MGSYTKAINMMKEANTIAVFMHINPDGDCIGSSLALYGFLTKQGKAVHCFGIVNKNRIVPDKLAFLPFTNIYNTQQLDNYDLCIGVDVADAKRLGDEPFKIFLTGKKSIVIDHHESYKDFANHTIREVSAASTTQIIYKILHQYDKNTLDKDIATLLYAGIVTDSGCFSFNSTSKETHTVAAELFEHNIEHGDINYRLMKNISNEVFNLKLRILSKAEFFEDKQIGAIFFRQNDFIETNTEETNTEGMINSILNISTVEIAISIAEIGDKRYKVSFRTKDKVNAASCAKCFGGGGHAHAAGCRVYGYWEDIYDKVISAAKEMLSYA